MNSGLILGISVFGHDSSVALVDASSGKILYALIEERYSNIKHDGGFPVAALARLLARVDMEKLGKIAHVAINIDPDIVMANYYGWCDQLLGRDVSSVFRAELDRLLSHAVVFHDTQYPSNYLQALLMKLGVGEAETRLVLDKLSWHGNFVLRYRRLMAYLAAKFEGVEIVPVGHHLCHAASAFYCSDFEKAAVLTVDGQGETDSITLNMASDSGIETLATTQWPHSLGALYMQLAWYLGFDGDAQYPGFGDEYKVMGMSAYGSPRYLDVFKKIGAVNKDGRFEFDFGEYVALSPVEGCLGHSQVVFTENFYRLLGDRRPATDPIEQRHYDIACSGQRFLEEMGVALAKHLKAKCPGVDSLCIAGGVGLNGLMNMKILREAGFRKIFIQPASGDDGTSVGAALYVHHHIVKGPRGPALENAYLGLVYGDGEIVEALNAWGLSYHKPDSIHADVARHLKDGKIVARYTERAEFGPRALGHRSILANPALAQMKDEINARIKHREAFRPFAPACLESEAGRFFEIDSPAPYMLLICEARDEARREIPAVVHADGTARLQTVSAKDNPDLYATLSNFADLSGIPVLLNTSFNVNGEAIVETPLDAVESFLFMEVDYLAIGPYLVSRAGNVDKFPNLSLNDFLKLRRERYLSHYFSHEMFLWSSGDTLETELEILRQQLAVYKAAAEERLTAIEKLDAEVRRLSAIQQPIENHGLKRIFPWVR